MFVANANTNAGEAKFEQVRVGFKNGWEIGEDIGKRVGTISGKGVSAHSCREVDVDSSRKDGANSERNLGADNETNNKVVSNLSDCDMDMTNGASIGSVTVAHFEAVVAANMTRTLLDSKKCTETAVKEFT